MRKFDFVIGNPPYQEETSDENGNKTFSPPVYDKFLDAAFKIADKVEMIHPARFLSNSGSTPKAWNQKMLNDEHFKILEYEEDATKVFPNTDIKGGVVISYHDKLAKFDAIQIFEKYQELNPILTKAKPHADIDSLLAIIYTQNRLNLNSLYKDFPSAKEDIGSEGKDSRFEKNIFSKLEYAFSEAPIENGIKTLGISNNKRVWRYIPDKYVDLTHPNLYKYKIAISVANGKGKFGEVLSNPEILSEGVAYTRSFIGVGACDSESEALAILKYIKTKFARTMLSVLRSTQMTNPEVWKYVPLQDFTEKSDIDWSKPVSEIDQQLYKKYNLTQEEIDFIETHVKEMA